MNGLEYTPHVFLSAVARDGEGDAYLYNESGTKERLTAEVNDQSELDLVHDALEGVIYEETPSTTAHFTNLPVRVAGKTGTGEKSGEDPYSWFIVYAPADDPKYVVASLVEQGGFGATTSLHAVRHVLGVIYDSPDDAAVSFSDTTR